MMIALREHLTEKVSELPEDCLDELSEFIEFLFWKSEEQSVKLRDSKNYQVEIDPLIGLFSGPQDLSERAESILEQDTQENIGWTWKHTSA